MCVINARTRARALIALGRPAAAVALLEPLLAAAEAAGRVGHQIPLQIVRALALQAAGDQGQAAATLAQALEQGAARGYVRSFLDEGPAVAALLEQMQSSTWRRPGDAGGRMQPSIARLLAAFAVDQGTREPGDKAMESRIVPQIPLSPHPPVPLSFAEPLTPRERELLRLIDAGLSNQAIADRLVLSVGTVKFYLSTLYGKLDVRGRTEARARARALGLLP